MLHLICPADVPELTGGSLYNRRLLAHAPQIEYVRPASRELAAWLSLVEAGDRVIVDSIYFERAHDFDALIEAAHGLRLILLAHYRPSLNPNLTREQRAQLEARELALASRAELVIATSAYLQRSLIELGIEPHKLRLCTPGVEAICTTRVAAVRPAKTARSILTVGNLVPEKGQLELLTYLEPYASQVERWTIVGGMHDPDYATRLERAIAASPLRAKVFVTGPLAPERIPQLLADASLFALATHYESYPLAIAEALAAGVPVIASDVGGVAELVDHGRAGLLCPPHDSAAWHAALAQVLRDDDTLARLADGARRKGATLLTWKQVAERFLTQVGATLT